uniref:NADH-ubiquinone oxidoreductase chain 6 n=1 Tax=Morimospasma tuberculatum TaxID=2874575 RepID=A0AA96V3G3_9CUCU|nr:NADH dehydrogenase subunit 6 [Morimospasma tuberculatum]
MFKIMIMLTMMMAILFMLMNHPLSLGMILFLETILVSLMSGMLHYNYWFSYMIFLIMIGGMLVLFIYMTSVASNEKFKFSPKILMIILTIISTLMLMILFLDSYYLTMILSSEDTIPSTLNFKFEYSLSKFTPINLTPTFFVMIIYLFITLIMVVKITNINYGPLRQSF